MPDNVGYRIAGPPMSPKPSLCAASPPTCRRLFGRLWLLALAAAIAVALGCASADPDRMLDVAGERYGARGVEAVRAWRTMLADAQPLDELGKLERTNAFFNRRTSFEDDAVVWNDPDYWATPLETLVRRAGDCEDFSIAKYMSLRVLGIPAERLRLIYVRAQIGGPQSGVSQAHMVVGFYASPDDEPLVLDNLIGEIRPASRRPDLFPIFSFNSEGLWVGGAAASSADPTARLSRWRSALERMQKEGLQ